MKQVLTMAEHSTHASNKYAKMADFERNLPKNNKIRRRSYMLESNPSIALRYTSSYTCACVYKFLGCSLPSKKKLMLI